MPTTALTPELALARLHELSAEVREAVVLDAAGNLLAGPREMAAAAAALIGATDCAAVEVADERGTVYAVRDHRHAIVAVAARTTLPAIMFYDLRVVLVALAGGSA